MMSALKRVFRALDLPERSAHNKDPHTQEAAGSSPSIRFEPMEPRVLLSADPVVAVSGAISTPGETNQYNFTIASDTKVVFDSLSNNANLNWSLNGPDGNVVSERSFAASDSSGLSGTPAISLAAGTYTIAVNGSSSATGAYGFRVLDLQKADGIVAGTAVTGQISPANETDTYKFDATAGDHFFLDVTGRSGGDVTWQLLDPSGQQVFGPTAMNSAGLDVDLPNLTATGTYTLLLEGKIGAVDVANYSFTAQLLPPDYVPPAAPVTTNTWIGGAGGNWNTASNWSKGAVPTATDNVYIGLPAGQTVNISSGAVTVNSLTSECGLTISGGATLNLNGVSKINGALNLTGGTLGGTGAVTVGGAFNVSNGSMLTGSGTFITQGTSLITHRLTLNGSKAWINQGTATVSGSGDLYCYYSSGSLTNAAGATFNLSSSAGESFGFYAGSLAVNNAGTLNQTATGTHSISGNIAFNNTGTVNVIAGTLSINGSGTDSGLYNIASGASCNFNGGTRTVSAGWNTAGAGTVAITGGTTNVSGTVTVSGNLTLAGGTLGGSGALTICGAFNVSNNSTLTGSGTFITQGTSLITHRLTLNGSKAWINQGTATVSGSGDLYCYYSSGSLTNAAGATFNLSSSAGEPLGLWSGSLVVNNAGTLNQTATGAHSINGSIAFNNTGTVNVIAGTLSINGNGTDSGTYNVSSGATVAFSGGTRNL
ncbi:beta strand repeat-containing protein, partial [Azospira restricta]